MPAYITFSEIEFAFSEIKVIISEIGLTPLDTWPDLTQAWESFCWCTVVWADGFLTIWNLYTGYIESF